jgi:hypothetical protein
MRRWVPFAIAIFMLTPFALWLGLGLFGPGGGAVRIEGQFRAVLLAASLPLAGLFWIQNLRQLGDSMGAASRLRVAARLTALLPLTILGLGLLGAAWLLASGAGLSEALLALLGTVAMAGFGWLIARAPVEPGRVVAPAPAAPGSGAEDTAALLFFANVAMALVLLAIYWTPWVLFWAVVALVPVAFLLMIALAWWAAQGGVVEAPPVRRLGAPANDRAERRRAA